MGPRLFFSGSTLVEIKPRMQNQLIPADFDHIRDKPKVGHVGLVRVKNVVADSLHTGRIVKTPPQSHFEVTSWDKKSFITSINQNIHFRRHQTSDILFFGLLCSYQRKSTNSHHFAWIKCIVATEPHHGTKLSGGR